MYLQAPASKVTRMSNTQNFKIPIDDVLFWMPRYADTPWYTFMIPISRPSTHFMQMQEPYCFVSFMSFSFHVYHRMIVPAD